MHPELNYIFTLYEQMCHTAVVPLLGGPNVPTNSVPLQLPPPIQSIYCRKLVEDQEAKSLKEEKSLEIGVERLNCFVLQVTIEGDQLPNTGCPDKAEFFYLNWKISDANN